MATQHIAVEAKHFIGSGAKAWLIAGRIPGDDDDTPYLVLADDESLAQEVFEGQLYADGDVTKEEQAHLVERYNSSIIITTSLLLN
ncbi:hypothetical protein [Pseudomonas sp. EMN2]|uniref:hypothetical protein n=1 Tax=Pseudomonas sp. EMN2 TaxID=2615212 RepID=UPI0015B4F594|nr:hypothetical protein [Pseudomonas sp. EMN2]